MASVFGALPRLSSALSLIMEFRNLRVLQLTAFSLDRNALAQIAILNLDSLHLTGCSSRIGYFVRYPHSFDVIDLGSWTSLRKLCLDSVVVWEGSAGYRLPPNLKELQVIIPQVISGMLLVLDAENCLGLEKV
jgi:hypothetical protein